MGSKRFIKLKAASFATEKNTATEACGKAHCMFSMLGLMWSSVHLLQSLENATIALPQLIIFTIANSVTVVNVFCCAILVSNSTQCHDAHHTQHHSPTKPSIDSRMKSACPLCLAYSSIMCTKIQRKLGDSPLGHLRLAS